MNLSSTAVAAPPEGDSPVRVLDVEKRRVVVASETLADAGPSCDVLILGGGTGGVAAAQAAAARGVSVILVEPTRSLGGQFTSQLVPAPDENRYIEPYQGASTTNYRNLRRRVRTHYRNLPDIKAGLEESVGQCWVSRVSGTPDVWEKAINEALNPLITIATGDGRPIKRIYRRHQLARMGFLANGRVNYVDIVDLDSGKVTRIGAQFVLDATEDGSALEMAGCPTVLGQEAKSEFNEPRAPQEARPDWVQSFTYCFLVRWQTKGEKKMIEKPAEYDYFRQVGEYTLNYEYIDRGTVPYQMLKKAPGAGGSFWTYRRLVASSSFKNRPVSPEGDIALINWRGNDFHEQPYIGPGMSVDEQAFALNRARDFAKGFLYFLQNEAPRDEGGIGYPEIQPLNGTDVAGVDEEGFALHPYIRESRRLKAKFTLNENHLLAPPTDKDAKWGEAFPDSVGCALYAVDIHPAKGEPPLLVPALPYHIPLGSFLTSSGPVNVLPAAKNIGATRLALASARMHPTEWLIGETAGALAAFCLRRNIADPSAVRADSHLLTLFQWDLRSGDYPLYWSDILP